MKEHPAWFHRFDAVWTPTVVILDSGGKERMRIEGYLGTQDFTAALESALGRVAFFNKKFADAERWFDDVVTRFGNTHFAAEAMYWRAVSKYSASHDSAVLGSVAEELRSRYPNSVAALKAVPWLPAQPKQEVA